MLFRHGGNGRLFSVLCSFCCIVHHEHGHCIIQMRNVIHTLQKNRCMQDNTARMCSVLYTYRHHSMLHPLGKPVFAPIRRIQSFPAMWRDHQDVRIVTAEMAFLRHLRKPSSGFRIWVASDHPEDYGVTSLPYQSPDRTCALSQSKRLSNPSAVYSPPRSRPGTAAMFSKISSGS